MKTIITVILFCISTIAFSQTIPNPIGKVNDFANILQKDSANQLDRILENYSKSTTNQIAIVTIPSLQGYSIEDFSIALAKQWGIGHKKINNGILLIVAPAERKIRIEVGYGLEPYLTDAMSNSIIQNILKPNFKNGNYTKGFYEAVPEIINVIEPSIIANKNAVALENKKQEIENAPSLSYVLFILLGVSLISVWLFHLMKSKKMEQFFTNNFLPAKTNCDEILNKGCIYNKKYNIDDKERLLLYKLVDTLCYEKAALYTWTTFDVYSKYHSVINIYNAIAEIENNRITRYDEILELINDVQDCENRIKVKRPRNFEANNKFVEEFKTNKELFESYTRQTFNEEFIKNGYSPYEIENNLKALSQIDALEYKIRRVYDKYLEIENNIYGDRLPAVTGRSNSNLIDIRIQALNRLTSRNNIDTQIEQPPIIINNVIVEEPIIESSYPTSNYNDDNNYQSSASDNYSSSNDYSSNDSSSTYESSSSDYSGGDYGGAGSSDSY